MQRSLQDHDEAAQTAPKAGGCLRRLSLCRKHMLEHTPVRICGPVEKGTHTGAGLLAGLVSWGVILEQAVPEGLIPWKRHVLRRFVKNCGLWKGLTLEGLMDDYSVWEEPDPWSGQDSKEGVAETICDEDTAAPIPCPLIPLEGEEVENLG